MRIKLLAVVVALLLAQLVCAAPKFTSLDGVYTVPIRVSEHAAPIMGGGVESVLDFVRLQNPGIWTYAFNSELSRDPLTGKFQTHVTRGLDFFLRYFGDKLALISVSWMPLETKLGIGQIFEALVGGLTSSQSGTPLSLDGKVEACTISGASARNGHFQAKGYSDANMTFTVVKLTKLRRLVTIASHYSGGYSDPAGDFARLKSGIVFKK